MRSGQEIPGRSKRPPFSRSCLTIACSFAPERSDVPATPLVPIPKERRGSSRQGSESMGNIRRSGVMRATESPGLTHRQLELLTLVAQGKTNAQIALELKLSQSAVFIHAEPTGSGWVPGPAGRRWPKYEILA